VSEQYIDSIMHGATIKVIAPFFKCQEFKMNPGKPTWCGRNVMRLATMCTNRQRSCLPLHMAVRLTSAVDSVEV